MATAALARLLLGKIWNIILTGREYSSDYTKKAKYKLKPRKKAGQDKEEEYNPARIAGILSGAFAVTTAGSPLG